MVAATKPRVLFADDEPHVRVLLRAILKSMNRAHQQCGAGGHQVDGYRRTAIYRRAVADRRDVSAAGAQDLQPLQGAIYSFTRGGQKALPLGGKRRVFLPGQRLWTQYRSPAHLIQAA